MHSLAPLYREEYEEFSKNLYFASTSIRWSNAFSQFARMKDLRTFRFGSSSQWVIATESRHSWRGFQYGGHPVMPWEDEKNIENLILEERYVIWDDWNQEYQPHWKKRFPTYYPERCSDGYSTRGIYWTEEWMSQFQPYPDCKEEDQAALDALLRKIGMKRAF